MRVYQFNESTYQWLLQNKEKVAWNDFANAGDEILDWSCLSNPYIYKDSKDYKAFKDFFDVYFQKNVYFNFVLRIINSFMIVGVPYSTNNCMIAK